VSKNSSVSFDPPAHYLVLRNRGDENGAGNIELSLQNGESVDTFLLKYDERENFGPSEYTRLCYKRDDEGPKVRLDIHAY